MIGGWESFYGRLGEYHHSPLADGSAGGNAVVRRSPQFRAALPDRKSGATTRSWRNFPGTSRRRSADQRVKAEPQTETLLAASAFAVSAATGQAFTSRPGARALLVVGRHGAGRTAALATDVAPHWVGGFVDWGDGASCRKWAADRSKSATGMPASSATSSPGREFGCKVGFSIL